MGEENKVYYNKTNNKLIVIIGNIENIPSLDGFAKLSGNPLVSMIELYLHINEQNEKQLAEDFRSYIEKTIMFHTKNKYDFDMDVEYINKSLGNKRYSNPKCNTFPLKILCKNYEQYDDRIYFTKNISIPSNFFIRIDNNVNPGDISHVYYASDYSIEQNEMGGVTTY